MSVRPVRVTEITGPAAAAVRSAREGESVDITARGEVVARIVPATESSYAGMRMVGSGTDFKLPKVVVRIPAGQASPADQVVDDRRR